MFDGGKRNADVIAVTRMAVAVLPFEDLQLLSTSSSHLHSTVMMFLARASMRKLRRTIDVTQAALKQTKKELSTTQAALDAANAAAAAAASSKGSRSLLVSKPKTAQSSASSSSSSSSASASLSPTSPTNKQQPNVPSLALPASGNAQPRLSNVAATLKLLGASPSESKEDVTGGGGGNSRPSSPAYSGSSGSGAGAAGATGAVGATGTAAGTGAGASASFTETLFYKRMQKKENELNVKLIGEQRKRMLLQKEHANQVLQICVCVSCLLPLHTTAPNDMA